ncbi:unnamed protein product, partial [Amoebophrya sp. A25]
KSASIGEDAAGMTVNAAPVPLNSYPLPFGSAGASSNGLSAFAKDALTKSTTLAEFNQKIANATSKQQTDPVVEPQPSKTAKKKARTTNSKAPAKKSKSAPTSSFKSNNKASATSSTKDPAHTSIISTATNMIGLGENAANGATSSSSATADNAASGTNSGSAGQYCSQCQTVHHFAVQPNADLPPVPPFSNSSASSSNIYATTSAAGGKGEATTATLSFPYNGGSLALGLPPATPLAGTTSNLADKGKKKTVDSILKQIHAELPKGHYLQEMLTEFIHGPYQENGHVPDELLDALWAEDSVLDPSLLDDLEAL